MPVTTYTGTFGRAELKHLLQRSLFGATNADLAHFAGQSLDQVVDALLTIGPAPAPPLKNYWILSGGTPSPNAIDPIVPFGSTWVDTPNVVAQVNANVGRMSSFQSWRTGLMITQDRTLEEKLVLFWYNHMPTQMSVVFNGLLYYGYDRLLRTNCVGNFRQLMYDVTVDPCMMEYLNGRLNTASAPDENYARELMELFTLGEGSGYDEVDVQAAARVLTGWSTREITDTGSPIIPETYFNPAWHDTNSKTFSGFFANTVIQGLSGPNGGATELNAMLDMIFARQQVSLFMCRQLYRFFVHGEIDAATETNLIAPLAELFRNNASAPDQIKIVMKAMLTSDHFFSTNIRSCMVMSPADLIIGLLRKMDAPWPNETTQLEARYKMFLDTYYMCLNCGQALLDPPNVAGWPAYYQGAQYDDLWLDSASYASRNFVMQGIIGQGFSTGNDLYQATSRNLLMKVSLPNVVAQFSDPTDPNAVVNDTAELLLNIPVSQAVRNQLKTSRLLLGQQSDIYWTDAYEIYAADPNTTDQTGMMVPNLLLYLFLDMAKAAETQVY